MSALGGGASQLPNSCPGPTAPRVATFLESVGIVPSMLWWGHESCDPKSQHLFLFQERVRNPLFGCLPESALLHTYDSYTYSHRFPVILGYQITQTVHSYGPVCPDVSNLTLPHAPSFHLESELPPPLRALVGNNCVLFPL